MDQDAKESVSISKYAHKLTNKPPVVAATRLKLFEKEKITIEQQVRNLQSPTICCLWPFDWTNLGFFAECELRYLLVNYVTYV